MNYQETVPAKIDASPTRIPHTTVEPPTPHALHQLEVPPLLLSPPEVRVGVGLDNVEDREDDSTEDKDEGTGGNEIDVPEGPTLQNI